MSAVADVLNGAADLIDRDGWAQRAYRLPTGERCATGAVIESARAVESDNGVSWTPLYVAATEVVHAELGISWLTPWNDEPGRTQAEVAAALRAAAERAA